MSETLTNPSILNKRTTLGLLAGSALLSACGFGQPYAKATPVDRYQYDYLGYAGNAGIEHNCLQNSQYDPFADETSSASASYDAKTGILTLTPSSGDTLQLDGFDQRKHTLEPADKASEQIFEAYGCVVEQYED